MILSQLWFVLPIFGVAFASLIIISPSTVLADLPDVPLWEMENAFNNLRHERLLCSYYGGFWSGTFERTIDGECDYTNSQVLMPNTLSIQWRDPTFFGLINDMWRGYVESSSYSHTDACNEGYTFITRTYGNIGLPTCIENEFYNSAICDENFKLEWSTSQPHCFKISDYEIQKIQHQKLLDEIKELKEQLSTQQFQVSVTKN